MDSYLPQKNAMMVIHLMERDVSLIVVEPYQTCNVHQEIQLIHQYVVADRVNLLSWMGVALIAMSLV